MTYWFFFSLGEKGTGKSTQKPLHYKSCLFHRVVKDFMVQGGDFSEGKTSILKNKIKYSLFINLYSFMYMDLKVRQVSGSTGPIFFWAHLIFWSNKSTGNALVIQWLGYGTFTAEGPGSVPGWGTEILQAAWHGQN